MQQLPPRHPSCMHVLADRLLHAASPSLGDCCALLASVLCSEAITFSKLLTAPLSAHRDTAAQPTTTRPCDDIEEESMAMAASTSDPACTHTALIRALISPPATPYVKAGLPLQDLAQANEDRASRPWVLVMGHRPMYCTVAVGGHCDGEHEASRLVRICTLMCTALSPE